MSHEVLDQQSLALDRVIAGRIRENPALIDLARSNLQSWLQWNSSVALIRCYREWLEIIDSPNREHLFQILTTDSEENRRLRQNSPFVGILTTTEVLNIKSRVRGAKMRMQTWCVQCDQDVVVRFRYCKTGELVWICKRCERLWIDDWQPSSTESFELKSYVQNQGLQFNWDDFVPE